MERGDEKVKNTTFRELRDWRKTFFNMATSRENCTNWRYFSVGKNRKTVSRQRQKDRIRGMVKG